MNPVTFFDKFGLLADTPYGVQKLRELILQLAVQGKLVPQDPNDEPAAVLLEKIKAEKDKLVKEGEIRKGISLTSIKEEEIPYKLPKEWQWVRLDNLVSLLGDGLHGTPKYSDRGDYFFINGNNLNDGKILIKNNTKKASIDEYNKYKKKLNERTVLVSINGTLGNVAFYDNEKIILGKSACYFNLLNNINKCYFKLLINTRYFIEYAFKNATGSTIKNVSLKSMRLFLVPLPPFAEQHRIVAKVDQLMALCDELESRQQKKQEARLRLNSAALDKLLTAHEPAEFANHRQRVCDNFDLLYDNPETVGEIRKAILQLAVQGKLVRQDENDEPAAVLLEKIRAEKERLVKEGKIKKSKPLLSLKKNEIPFKLPLTWTWIPLGEVVDYNGASKVSPNDIPDDAWLLDLENIEKNTSRIVQRIIFKDKKSKSTKSKFENGDVLYGKLRPYLNKVVVADGAGYCTTEIIPLHGYYGIFPKYLMYALKRPDFLEYANSKTYGVKMPRLGTEDARYAPFPLPPFEEQRRIVARVDQLMALCDELEAKLNQSQTDGAKLMEAVVAGLVGA